MNATTTVTTPTSTGAVRPNTYFWVISVDKPGVASATTSGTYIPRPGDTRQDAYTEIYTAITTQDPSLRGATVLFFSLEPNGL